MPARLVLYVACVCSSAEPIGWLGVAYSQNNSQRVEVPGQALFANGTPASQVQLEFTPVQTEPTVEFHGLLRTQTDESGQFRLPVAGPVATAYQVCAQKWVDGNRLSWRSQWEGDLANTPSLDLVFENRGRLLLKVFGARSLPEGYDVQLEIGTPAGQPPSNLHMQLERSAEGLTLTGLEPGEYRVDAYVMRIRERPWSTTVTIPNQHPFRALGVVRLPEFEFGTLTARVVQPDGVTPADGETLWIEADGGKASGKRYRVDATGSLMAPDLPVGPVRIRPLDNPDLAPVATLATIHANAETQMATLRLPAAEEVFSWLEGKLTAASGRPLPGITCGGMFSEAGGLGWTVSDELGVRCQYDHESGRYRIRFPAGKRRLKIDLQPAGQAFGGAFLSQVPQSPKCMVVDVELRPGETLQRDLIVPPAQDGREIAVSWGTPGQVRVTVLKQLEPGLIWASEQWVDGADCTLTELPGGALRIQLREAEGEPSLQEMELDPDQSAARF